MTFLITSDMTLGKLVNLSGIQTLFCKISDNKILFQGRELDWIEIYDSMT